MILTCTGGLTCLMKTLTSSLVHSEAYFTKNTNETLQVSRLQYYLWCALISAAVKEVLELCGLQGCTLRVCVQ